ncbi:outer membrane protein [Luteibacter rhizovicinus]|uniref:Outer membrane protein n=1 Tax=Luteibacter rhizovicinus TaxID=242606 RepID=A0A4R3YL07_9GAMM|nr:MipA/OmpV family protein [Luteibacter rhizovicinus]TCV92891.1 outer membrane protein [Luteibacter rhizovicinus]
MSTSIRFSHLGLLILAGALPQLSHADEPVPLSQKQKEDAPHWGLGVGIAAQQQPYRGVGSKVTPFPLVTYQSKWISLFGNTLSLKAPKFSDNFSVSLRASFALGDGYKASDSSYLQGMRRRNGSIWIGPAANWHNDWFDMAVSWSADASGESKGQQAAVSFQKDFTISPLFQITPYLGATWLDKKYVDYYYGVRPEEVRANRAAYVGGSTVNTRAGVRVGYKLSEHQHLIFDVGATMLGSKIKDSPLVDSSSVPTVAFGYFYAF